MAPIVLWHAVCIALSGGVGGELLKWGLLKKKALGRGAPGIDFCFLAAGSAMIGRVHVAMGESALRRLAELCAQPA